MQYWPKLKPTAYAGRKQCGCYVRVSFLQLHGISVFGESLSGTGVHLFGVYRDIIDTRERGHYQKE